jgi:energy-converting hydrogenase A subunit M
MKSETIIKKIINQIDANAEIMKSLLEELDDSLDKENFKLKEDIAKKISSTFNLDLNQVLKKIIKKKKNMTNLELTEQIEQIEDLEEKKDFIPIYKKILHNDKEYFYDDKPDGVVFSTEQETQETKIVGYFDTSTKSIKFI